MIRLRGSLSRGWLQSHAEDRVSLADWKRTVLEQLATTLKRHGFRKKGLTFVAARDGATLLISLQSSRSSTATQLRFTINLGIVIDALADPRGGGIWDAHWQQRLGFFMLERQDHWWVCATDDEARRAGAEVAALVAEKALPEMERLASPHALEAVWASGECTGITDRQRLDFLDALRANRP